ncbi:MAG: Sec-independent protein secretion pathway component [Pseudomonadota bacterium]
MIQDDGTMPLLEHLREARRRLFVCAGALLPALVVGFGVSDRAFDFLAAPMNAALRAHGSGTLAVISATEGFMVQMKVAGLVAALLATPVVASQVWGFVRPGLHAHERRTVVPLTLASTLLFLLGCAFCYVAIFEVGFPFFLAMNGEGVQAVLSIDAYLGMAITMLLSFGLAFQLPVVVFVLARLGMVDARDLLRGFRYAVVAIFIVAAVLTPSPDALSQLLMAGPLMALYVLGIGVAALASTKSRERAPDARTSAP